MRINIDQETLKNSNNAVIHELANNDFLTGAEIRQDSMPSAVFLRDLKGQLIINGRVRYSEGAFVDLSEDIDEIAEDLVNLELIPYLLNEFPGKTDGVLNAALLLQFHSQGPAYYILSPLKSLTKQHEDILPGYTLTEGRNSTRETHLYYDTKTQKVYYEVVSPTIQMLRESDVELVRIGGASWKFELTAKGFKHCETIALSEIVRDFYAGNMTVDVNAEFDRLHSLQKPLRSRFLAAYAAIFDTTDLMAKPRANLANAVKKPRVSYRWAMAEAFLGLPRAGNIGNIVSYVMGGFILSPVKNLLKLVAEFLPSMIEQTCSYAADRLIENFPNAETVPNPTLRAITTVAATAAIMGLRLLQGIAFVTRQLTARVTSPVRSAKEAWKIHPVLGVLSGLVTVVAVTALAIVASPLLVSMGISSVSGSLSSLPGVKTVISGVGSLISKAAGAMGMSAATLAVKTGIIVGAVFITAVSTLQFAFKTGFAWLSSKATRHKANQQTETQKPKAEPVAGLNTQQIQAKMGVPAPVNTKSSSKSIESIASSHTSPPAETRASLQVGNSIPQTLLFPAKTSVASTAKNAKTHNSDVSVAKEVNAPVVRI